MKNPKSKGGAKPGNKNAIGNSGGRPSKYLSLFANQASKLCLLGYTDSQLAAFFEVAPATIDEWKKKHVEFSGALRDAKDLADGEVAAGLYKRAVGFYFDETHTENGVLKKIITKYLPPDPGAATLWLTNRQKALWRSRPENEVDFDSLTDAQLDELVNRIIKVANNRNETKRENKAA